MRARMIIAAAVALAGWACDDGGDSDGDPSDVFVIDDMEPAEPDAGSPEPDEGMADPDEGMDEPDEGMVEPDPDMGMEEVDPGEPVGTCGEMADAKSVNGWMYLDVDASDRSTYASSFADPDVPFDGGALRLLGPDGEIEPQRCDDGSYVFPDLTDGTYFSVVEPPEGELCSQRNCPGRFARAVIAGQAKMVTFGDSIAVVGANTLFPTHVANMLSPLAEIDSVNVAIGGTTSQDWLPRSPIQGEGPFERNLLPVIADADMIVITLGGNDVMAYIASFGGIPPDIPAAIEGARDVVRQVVDNLVTILAAIREVNADADILYLLYADYTQATGDPIWGLVGGLLGRETLAGVLELARDSMPEEEHLVVADLFGASEGLPLHEYLADQLHFNDRGQIFYAQEIFATLGGVLIGPSPLPDGITPLGLRRSYGFRAIGEVEAQPAE